MGSLYVKIIRGYYTPCGWYPLTRAYDVLTDGKQLPTSSAGEAGISAKLAKTNIGSNDTATIYMAWEIEP